MHLKQTQVPLELLLGWKLRKLTILRPFWPLDDVTLGYCLQKKRKSNKTHSFHLFMMIYWNLVHSSSRAPWRLYHVPFCLGGDQCDAQSTQIYLCAENWWAVLLPKQKCQQVNIIGPLNYPYMGSCRCIQLGNQMMQKLKCTRVNKFCNQTRMTWQLRRVTVTKLSGYQRRPNPVGVDSIRIKMNP